MFLKRAYQLFFARLFAEQNLMSETLLECGLLFQKLYRPHRQIFFEICLQEKDGEDKTMVFRHLKLYGL